jgi:hypothetical protein
MKTSSALLSISTILAISSAPALAQIGGGGPSTTATSQNVFCEKNLRSTVTRVTKSVLPSGYGDLKDVQLNSDFRFPSNDLPFSQALALNDPVTGQSVGVLDQNFIPGGSKVSSAWTRYNVRIGGYWLIRSGGGFSTPIGTFIPFEADILWISDGSSFLVVKGCNGHFTITKEIAEALRSYPSGKNGYIRFSTEGTGSFILSEIGKDTVAAWKKVYANWTPEAPPKVESLGF